MSKLTHALDGILKLSENPPAYLKSHGNGGDWTAEDLLRTINERARTIVDELEREGLIKVERNG